jgi:hypothetical protein
VETEGFAATSPNSDRGSEFKLVVVYDDFGNGICAKKFFDGLAESFGKILTFIPRFLKFEELLSLHVGERLAKEVAVADMVVFVADEYADLPDFVEKWIRTWETTTRIERSRLLALFSTRHRENNRRTPVQSCLRQAARRARMKFLLQAAPLSKTRCRVGGANPKAKRQAGQCRRKGRNLCSAAKWPENVMPRTVAGGTTADLPRTPMTDAIIEVMRARRRATSPPTTPLAHDGRAPRREIDRNRALTDL